MIPACFTEYRTEIPMINEVVEWSLLRKWKLSEVYRIKLKTGESRIIKWGGYEMAGEAAIYQSLLQPLGIRAPHIYRSVQLQDSVVMIMEDAGKNNLEEEPLRTHFLDAARQLADIRMKASDHLMLVSREAANNYMVSAEQLLSELDDLVRAESLAGHDILLNVKQKLPQHLEKVYQEVPLSIVHQDYHAKNLLVRSDGVMAIDWPIAYLSPHLGDLYCLIRDAAHCTALSREELVSAYASAVLIQHEEINWQVTVGGLCWLIKTLRWLVFGGTSIIPGSEAWIDDLLQEAAGLSEGLV